MTWKAVGLSALAVLWAVSSRAADPPRRVLLLAGAKSHAPGAHEHLPGMKILAKTLDGVAGLEVEVVDVSGPWPEGPERIARADGIVMYLDEGMLWQQSDAKRQAALEALRQRGGGVVALHWALGGREPKHIPFHLRLVGGCHGGPDRKYIVTETDLTVASPDHPVTRAVRGLRLKDEYYYRLKWARQGTITPLLTATLDGLPDQTIAWAFERPDGGRSFGLAALHAHATWGVDDIRRLVAQSVLWTVKLPVPQDGLPLKALGKR